MGDLGWTGEAAGLQRDLKGITALVAWRAAVSAVAGLLVCAFAAAALAVGTVGSVDRLAVRHTTSDSLAPMLSAVAGAGLVASTVVFLCFVINDVRRWVGPWVVAHWRHVLFPLRALSWVLTRSARASVVMVQAMARTPVVVEALWLVRTLGTALGWVLACVTVVGGSALIYVGIVVTGLACVSQSTRIVLTLLDDPPRQLAMALGLGAATTLMYAGLGAFALGAWLPYRVTRAALQRAARAKMSLWGR